MSKIEKELNAIAKGWIEREESLPEDKKRALEELENMNWKEFQFKVIKRKKPEIKDGDIFVLSPKDGVYFYGRVLKSDIDHIHKSSFIQGKHVIFVFKAKTREISMDNLKIDYNELLINPSIVDISYWNKGYFFNIGNIELSKEEKEVDYGFIDSGIFFDKFVKANGEELNHQPKILGMYGISTMTGIAREVQRELIISPELLEFND